LQERLANFECCHVSVNRSCWQFTTFFTFFLSKLEMPIYRKVVSLEKLDIFILVDFEVFR
jgi:hypothetical protein